MKKSTIVIVLFLANIICYSQTTEIKLNNINGKGYDKNIDKSLAIAIQKAKQNALNKAGIAENIHVQNALEKAEVDGEYIELFSSNAFMELNGNVKDVEVIDKQTNVNNGVIETIVKINCTVVKYETNTDPHFNVGVLGIDAFYNHLSHLEFTVISSKDCFMKAWLFTKNDAFAVFPNAIESNFLLTAGDSINFPRRAIYELDSEGEKQQINRLIIVFLKEDFSYNDRVTYENISDWIVSIPPDKKLVKYFSFTLTE